MLCFPKGHVLAQSITAHRHVVFFERGTSLRAINHKLVIMSVFSRRSSVLSITTHHHVVFSRRARPSVLSITTLIVM
jgi:hypothetical protein